MCEWGESVRVRIEGAVVDYSETLGWNVEGPVSWDRA